MKRTPSDLEELLFLVALVKQIAPSVVAFVALYLLFRFGG